MYTRILLLFCIYLCSAFYCKTWGQTWLTKKQLFHQISPSHSNVHFNNQLKDSSFSKFNQYTYQYNGGGVALADFNNDGWVDLFFTGNEVGDRLYQNEGNLTFKDITPAFLNADRLWSTGVTAIDINNDGLLDIYISRAGFSGLSYDRSNILLLNMGNMIFKESALDYGLADTSLSTQATFFDYDQDGDLDCYLMNIAKNTPSPFNLIEREKNEWSKSDHLYENENGVYVDVTAHKLRFNNGFGLGISTADFNNNGQAEIYVANDFEYKDYFYYSKQSQLMDNIDQSLKHTSYLGMGTDAADLNNDGWIDLLELDMDFRFHKRSKTNMSSMDLKKFAALTHKGYHYQYMHNCLQLNNGNNSFSDISYLAKIGKTDWSWAVLTADFDNDGQKDIVVTNGYQRDFRNRDFIEKINAIVVPVIQNKSVKRSDKAAIEKVTRETNALMYKTYDSLFQYVPQTKEANYIFRNNGDLTFENKTKEWGFEKKVNSNGMAYADLDNDGDLDIVINNLNEVASIYENKANERRNSNFLDFKLIGPALNRFAVGARITLHYDNKLQLVEQFPVRGFQSSVDYTLHFGMGKYKKVAVVEIRWPDQKVTQLKNIKTNQTLVVDYKHSSFVEKKEKKALPLLFRNISTQFFKKYRHQEKSYNDFKDQILLPHKLSNNGPIIHVNDIDKDGLDDVIISGSKGHTSSCYFQKETGGFQTSIFSEALQLHLQHEDLGALFFDFDQDGDNDLYVCSGSNESREGSAYYQDRLYINEKGTLTDGTAILPQMLTSTKIVTAHDFDGDGDLDLFVGGRLVPQKYPQAPRSYLLRNDGDKFVDVTETYCKDLLYPGMVTGAEFADIDGDGQTDLTLVGEWMPLQTFLKKDGKFVKQPHQLQTEGLWFSLKKADIDQDGDMDFVAGNLGTNCKFKASLDKPFNIYADDFDDNGSWDMMLSSYEGDKNYPVRGRDCSSAQMPFITDSFPSFKSFAVAEIDEICGPKFDKSLHLTVRGFQSSVFLNDGKGNFEMRPLPNEAQFSPTLDMHIEDLDKDGHLDLMLVGNIYGTEVETVRYDAGRGAVLMGDGKGNFKSVPPHQSGFFAWENTKSIEKIIVKGKELYLVGVNNGPMLIFEKQP